MGLVSGVKSGNKIQVIHSLFFDNASTTQCRESALRLLQQFAGEDFGNPSSTHAYGQKAARAIREARQFFAQQFQVDPSQVIFTGSGTEANNLAISGTLMAAYSRRGSKKLCIASSSTEHPSVSKTIESLRFFEIEGHEIQVNAKGQLDEGNFVQTLNHHPTLLSLHQINNIIGTCLPVESLAKQAKMISPQILVHSDAVQAFGKFKVPRSGSSVDLVSISGHKIGAPKGVGALVLLNKKLLSSEFLRPLIWGGEQENGLRSGTQNAGLIAGFHAAAAETIAQQKNAEAHVLSLRTLLRELLIAKGLLSDSQKGPLRWNSPEDGSPYIVNLSAPQFTSSPLAKLLEQHGCMVSVGSACNSRKLGGDSVLGAMGLIKELQNSAFRISFSTQNHAADVEKLVYALTESLTLMGRLLGKGSHKGHRL